jgi:hypothetical protein
MTSAARRRLRIRLLIAGGVLAIVVGLYLYLNHEFMLAVVEAGGPRLAASDLSALRSALDGSPSVARLRAAGKIFAVQPGTRCTMLRMKSGSSCRGPRDYPVQVELLDGPRRGQEVWMCNDDVRWPIHPPP